MLGLADSHVYRASELLSALTFFYACSAFHVAHPGERRLRLLWRASFVLLLALWVWFVGTLFSLGASVRLWSGYIVAMLPTLAARWAFGRASRSDGEHAPAKL